MRNNNVSRVLCLLAVGASAWLTAPRAMAADACSAGSEHRNLDYWLGDWAVTNPGSTGSSRSRVYLELGGCVVVESWDNGKGHSGKNLFAYSDDDQSWRGMFADNQGRVHLFVNGKVSPGSAEFDGPSRGPDGQVVRNRIRILRLSADKIEQIWDKSNDGASWTTAFRGEYTRISGGKNGAHAIVKTDSGAIEGAHFGPADDDVAFLGVPYAAPPVGDLRWKPPQPALRWEGIRPATAYGPACPQLPAGWLPYAGWDEDCLYLNIWTTNLSSNSKAPVLVYFHGGSNASGYSQITPLGPPLARLGVVVVSANYRLGPMGFLAHPALSRESPNHSSGNYGLLDQIQALKWVRDNISRFGGDPTRITVMGQSAGAVDVCLLMTSPLATGLFQRAILQSGDCQSTLIPSSGPGEGERFANVLGIDDGPHATKQLREIAAGELLKTWSAHRSIQFEPIVDGWVLPEQPAKIFAEGGQVRIPIIVGRNADEASILAHSGDVKTLEQYEKFLRDRTGSFWPDALRAYPARSDADVPGQFLRFQNDSFAYGAWSMAQAMNRAGEKAFLYRFTYVESGKRAALGAYHGAELKFLSDSFPADWGHRPSDENFGRTLRTYWAQFVKTGDPNAPGLVEWPAFSARPEEYLELGETTGARPVGDRLRILGRIMDQILAERFVRPRKDQAPDGIAARRR